MKLGQILHNMKISLEEEEEEEQTGKIPGLEAVNVHLRYNLDRPLQTIQLALQVIRNQLDVRRRELKTRERRRNRH